MVKSCKKKLTVVEQEIMSLLCLRVGSPINQRGIANIIGYSSPSVARGLSVLGKIGLINVERDRLMNLVMVELNRDSRDAILYKRLENIRLVYESGVIDFLSENFPGCVVILFGSYSYGEDSVSSDVDIAVVGAKRRCLDFKKYEKILNRNISVNFYDDFNSISAEIKGSLCNGVNLAGGLGP